MLKKINNIAVENGLEPLVVTKLDELDVTLLDDFVQTVKTTRAD